MTADDREPLPPGVLPLNYHRTWKRPPATAKPDPTPPADHDAASYGRRAPFVQVPHALLDHTQSGLSPTEVRVWLVLATYANAAGTAWPSLRTIAERAGCCRTTVTTSLDALEAAGWIERQRRRDSTGAARSTLYLIHETPPDPGRGHPVDN